MDEPARLDPAARPQAVAAVVLVALAAAAAHLATAEAGAAAGVPFLPAGAVVAATLPLRGWLTARGGRAAEAVMFGGMVFAFLPAPDLTGVAAGHGLEYRLLAGLRNVALVAATLGGRTRTDRVAVGAALVITLFSFSLGRGWAVFGVAVAFAATFAAWLALGHWRSVAARLPTARPPVLWVCGPGVLGAAFFLAGVALYPAESKGWLERLAVPEVATLSEEEKRVLNEANGQTLNDLAEEAYGASAAGETVGAGGRAAGDEGGGETGGAPADGKESFRLARGGRPGDRPPDARTLFRLQGRGPGHVPMVTYAEFDGAAWHGGQSAGPRPQVSATIGDDDAWLQTIDPFAFNLAGDRAAPGDPDAAEEVRRAVTEFAVGGQGGRLVEPRRRPLDRDRLFRELARPGASRAPTALATPADLDRARKLLAADPALGRRAVERFRTSPEFRDTVLRKVLAERGDQRDTGLSPEVRALLDSWTSGEGRGWGQIDALIRGLRGHAVFDPAAGVPAGEADPTRYFLIESRRGPDFLFASTAAALLRHLGYPSRLVGGFYARPDDYSRLTGTTQVGTDDLHYWTQVQVSDGVWVDLEPTPGYEPPAPTPTGSGRAAAVAGQIRRHGPLAALAAAVLAAAWVVRRRAAERVATVWWLARAGRPVDQLVRGTWALLDRRAVVARSPRPQGMTLSAWAAALEPSAAAAAARDLAALAVATDHLVHAPGPVAARLDRPEAEVRAACRRAVRDWTVGALRGTSLPERRPA